MNAAAVNVSGALSSTGAIQAPAIFAFNPSSLGGSVQILPTGAAGYTGIIQFHKLDGSRNGYVGFNPEAGAMQYGSDTGAGHAFTGGDVAVSANIVLPNAGYLKAKKVDGTATRIMGITGADTLCIGGVDATIGNVVMEVAATPVISLTASAITLLNDANLGFTMSGGNPRITFDANDLLFYDRTANKFYFVIGGINVASIDASGNMRLKGTLTQSVTP
ncbi:MAG: hypothetical protein JF564_07575 [Sphingomonas sp.]|nr:hypothetical protein [Sphingomonas sp.]